MKEKAKMATEIARLKIELSNAKKKSSLPSDIDKMIPFPSKEIEEFSQLVCMARRTDDALGRLIIDTPSIVALEKYIGAEQVIKQLSENI